MEISACLAVAQELGLVAESGRRISSSGRSVLLLEPCSVVAKLGPSSELPRFATEVELARHVQRRRGPVVPALLRANPGPHIRGQWVISFWEYAPCEVGGEELELAAVPTYAELRAHLDDFPGRLPSFSQPIEACREVLARDEVPGLSRPELDLVSRALEAAVSFAVPKADLCVLHGDPHARNLTQSFGEVMWLDLKSACRGPLEWDLTALPSVGNFQPPNPERLASLRAVRSACVVIWCSQKPALEPHDREAIEYHLQQLAGAPAE